MKAIGDSQLTLPKPCMTGGCVCGFVCFLIKKRILLEMARHWTIDMPLAPVKNFLCSSTLYGDQWFILGEFYKAVPTKKQGTMP